MEIKRNPMVAGRFLGVDSLLRTHRGSLAGPQGSPYSTDLPPRTTSRGYLGFTQWVYCAGYVRRVRVRCLTPPWQQTQCVKAV